MFGVQKIFFGGIKPATSWCVKRLQYQAPIRSRSNVVSRNCTSTAPALLQEHRCITSSDAGVYIQHQPEEQSHMTTDTETKTRENRLRGKAEPQQEPRPHE